MCANYRGIKLTSHTLKIWERVIDRRLRQKITIGEEQFGFMPKKSTTDAIFALRMLIENYREGRKTLHCVFIDLEKAYDWVPREEVWHCLRKEGVSESYMQCIQDMYHGCMTEVRCAVGKTSAFKLKVGVHQESALSPFVFAAVMDHLTEEVRRETPWNMLFADDVVIVNETRGVEEELEMWREALECSGLKVSKKKTVHMCINKNGHDGDSEQVKMQGQVVPEVKDFKYLGSTIACDGKSDREVKNRVQAGWNNWRKVTGLVCDKKVPAKLKGCIHKAVVRPEILYGKETVPLNKSMMKKLDVAEMKMLKWEIGVTRREKIRNEVVRGKLRIKEISAKIKESRLRWYGHVRRKEEIYVGKRVMEMKLPGKRGRDRPVRRWMDNITEDMKELALKEEDTGDRVKWRERIRCSDPT